MSNPESLMKRTKEVIKASYLDVNRYFSENAEAIVQAGKHGRVDYVSIYTNTQDEYDELNRQATQTGEKIFDKGGAMYEFTDIALITSVIRVCNPNSDNKRLGGVDFVFDDFERVKRELPIRAPKIDPSTKELAGEEYTVMQIIDPDSPVSISFLSRSFVDIVHKTQQD